MARVTDEEFNAALPVMQKLLWGEQQDRERLQELGLNLIPVNFYSNTPSIAETFSAFEYAEAEPPYLNCGIFDQHTLRAQLLDLIPYAADFAPAVVGDFDTCRSYFWKTASSPAVTPRPTTPTSGACAPTTSLKSAAAFPR